MNVRLAFGARVRELRLLARMSQEGLAEAADLHRTYVGGIERGERNVSLENIWRLARALKVSPVAFFGGADARGKTSAEKRLRK